MADDLRVLPPAVPRDSPCFIDFEGTAVRAFAGESVALALWAAGVRTLARSTKFHRPRGAFCFEGHCGSCAIRIDGRPNVRACMTRARAGLRCERQNSFPSAEVDLLAAADWMFPDQMDHHTLMTGNRVANRLLVSLVRQMGGSGILPDETTATTPAPRFDAQDAFPDVCVVGAGPAGLTAATTLARQAPGARVMLVDEQPTPGGSWWAEPGGASQARAAVDAALAAGVELLSPAVAIGFFPEDHVAAEDRADAIPGTLAVTTAEKLWRVSARRILYATGAYDQNLPFFDNDRPGIISARACGRLAFRDGLRPGRRVAIVGPRDRSTDAGAYADRLAAGLVDAGMRADHVLLIDSGVDRPIAARGATTLRGLMVADAAGQERRVGADVVAVGAVPAPASELPRQHGPPSGAHVILDPARGGFVALVDANFCLRLPSGCAGVGKIFCCGDVTGYGGPILATRAGAAAATAIAHTLDQT